MDEPVRNRRLQPKRMRFAQLVKNENNSAGQTGREEIERNVIRQHRSLAHGRATVTQNMSK
jgi:hypothetical protein